MCSEWFELYHQFSRQDGEEEDLLSTASGGSPTVLQYKRKFEKTIPKADKGRWIDSAGMRTISENKKGG
jgi:hypothetical protein